MARRERRAELDIRPLSPQSRTTYARSWEQTQARFVDDPATALAQADALIIAVMEERGYPMDDFERRAEDISVDHPDVVQHYRAAHDISVRLDEDPNASTSSTVSTSRPRTCVRVWSITGALPGAPGDRRGRAVARSRDG